MAAMMRIGAYLPLTWGIIVAVAGDRAGQREALGSEGAFGPDAYRDAVLGVVASIPRGRVMTYAGIADYLAEARRVRSPRLIGRIMAGCDEALPWHRVVRAGGWPVRGHEAEALRRLRDDETPVRGPTGDRVDMAIASWAPSLPPRRPG
jgi:alkylated DNA nucleotide flippase Atl1